MKFLWEVPFKTCASTWNWKKVHSISERKPKHGCIALHSAVMSVLNRNKFWMDLTKKPTEMRYCFWLLLKHRRDEMRWFIFVFVSKAHGNSPKRESLNSTDKVFKERFQHCKCNFSFRCDAKRETNLISWVIWSFEG